MNKYELKTAYNKIALSDEFKSSAKEKLLACFDENSTAGENEQYLHTSKAVKLVPQPKKPWKIAVGVGAAAAAVGLGVWGVSAVIGGNVPIDTQPDSAASITQEDIDKAVSLVEAEEFKVLDTEVCDIDFDAQNELLVLQSWGIPEIRVFEKENGELTEDAVFGFGELNYIDRLELYPYEADGESYHYFTFHFDNGGVMEADVLAAIKVQGGYEVEYLLSRGTLDYSDITEPYEPYIADFYRIGWNQNDVAMVGDYNDITKEEYIALYEKYTGIADVLKSEEHEDINDIIENEVERKQRILKYECDNPVTVFEGSLRNGSDECDFKAYIYQMMSETEDTYRGNCAIEITEDGEVVDRNMLLVGYTLGQNGTEFAKNGDDGYFSVIELQSGSVLLSTREQGAVTEATLYTVKGDEIAQIERYFEDPADKPERDSSVRSFNLSRSYTTDKDDIIFDIGGEEVRVTIDFEELTLKCEDGFEGIVYGEDSVDISNDFLEEYQATVDKNYGEVRMLLDYYRKDGMPWDEETAFYIEGFPEVQFVWTPYEIKAVDTSGNEEVLFGGMPIWSVYLTDLNGDGLREICCGTSFGSGIVDDRIVAYDYAAKKLYELSDRGYNDYYLSYNGLTPLMVHERDYTSGELTSYCGRLMLDGDTLTFERGEDINTAEMEQYTLPMTIMTQSEHGGLTVPSGAEVNAKVEFSLPSSWECSVSTASYGWTKVFEIGAVWRSYEGINTEAYKTDVAYGETITVIDEKWGGDSDLYEYFIHTSTPIKYAPDGTYDVYRYVVESNGYYTTVSVMSDMGVSQETIDRVLESVKISVEYEGEEVQDSNDTETVAPLFYDKPLDINYTDAMLRFYARDIVGEPRFDEYGEEWVTFVQLDVQLPLGWRYEEISDSFEGAAYYNDKEIFRYGSPISESEGIDTAALMAGTAEGEEKYGADSDPYEYHLRTPDKLIYVVNSGDYNITLTFDANAWLSQSTIDSVLRSVVIEEYEECLGAIDGVFPIDNARRFIYNGTEYWQHPIYYRFVMDDKGNILEDDSDNYRNINDYLYAIRESVYIGAAEELSWTGDVRFYLVNPDVVLSIKPCGDSINSNVDKEELLSKYSIDQIYHAVVFEVR